MLEEVFGDYFYFFLNIFNMNSMFEVMGNICEAITEFMM